MSLDPRQSDSAPLRSQDELLAYFASGEKPRERHGVGLEHEKLLVDTRTWGPVPYDGPHGVEAVLAGLTAGGFTPFREHDTAPVIALQRGMLTVSLEPGGQLELSGTAAKSAREAHAENLAHLAEVRAVTRALGLLPVAMGYRPFGTTAEMPWMPKSRYGAMRRTLGARGALALDMMLMTATGQVSLDWSDEKDCARKVTLASRVAPLLVALYANSPLVGGRAVGKVSYRSHVWTAVDDARCGLPGFFLDGSFSYRRYTEWALDAPLLFLRRAGAYLTPPLTFRAFLAQGFEGHVALQSDWVDHLSTLFPEVRIKKVLEIRSADGVGAEMTGALPALYRGLLYDETALAEAEALLPRLDAAAHARWMAAARQTGLRARVDGYAFEPLVTALVDIARAGLRRLDPEDAPLLDPLEAQARQGASPAERLLRVWETSHSAEAVYRAAAL